MTFTDAQRVALEKRAITPEQATDHGVISARTVTDLPADTPRYWEDYLPALVFPWTSPDDVTQWQIRPDNPPKDATGREKKYVFPEGAKPILNTLRFDPANRASLIVEGTCQSIVAKLYAPAGYNVFGVAGCYSWLADGVPSQDLAAIEGTDVFVCMDADAGDNSAVYRAGEKLAHSVKMNGANMVRFIHLDGTGKSGLDDLVAGKPLDKRTPYITRLIEDARNRGGQSADKPASQKPTGSNNDRAADEAQVLAFAVLDRYTLARDESGALIGRARNGVARVALSLEDVLQRTAAALYRDGSDTLIGTHAAREAGFYLNGLTDYPTVTAELRSYHDSRNHRLVIDIGDDTGDVITVTGDGWTVGPNTDESLWFRRPGKQQPLYRPESGGTLDDLRTLFPTMDDDRWSLILGWVLAAPFTQYERPWLYFWGPRGSGKTGSAVSALNVWDPTLGGALERIDTNDVHLSVYNAMVPAFDNLSELKWQLSDFLATVVTGVTQSRRTLYTTSDETMLTVKRTGVLTGIDVKGVRQDLQERLISIEMSRGTSFVSKTDVESRWRQQGPRVLGAVLDAVAGILRQIVGGYQLTDDIGASRFVDYLRVLGAHDPRIARDFARLSEEDRESAALENPTLAALVEWVNNIGDTGKATTGDLLVRFNTWAHGRDDYEHAHFRGDAPAFGRFLSNSFGEPVGGVHRKPWRSMKGRGVRLHVEDSVAHNRHDSMTAKTGVPLALEETLRVFPKESQVTENAVIAVMPSGRPESTVNTGLRADGTPNPEYRPHPPNNPGSEPGAALRHVNSEDVTYSEWKRRMILGGRWVEPTPGFEWSDAA